LPVVTQVVTKDRQDLLVGLADEAVGVERDGIPTELAAAMRKAIWRIVPLSVRARLIAHENIRQSAVKQLMIQMIHGLLNRHMLNQRDARRHIVRCSHDLSPLVGWYEPNHSRFVCGQNLFRKAGWSMPRAPGEDLKIFPFP